MKLLALQWQMRCVTRTQAQSIVNQIIIYTWKYRWYIAQVKFVLWFRNSCWTKQHRSLQIEIVIIPLFLQLGNGIMVQSLLRSFMLKLEMNVTQYCSIHVICLL